MMESVASVIAQYPTLAVQQIERLDKNGGLSGAELWKLQVGGSSPAFCLRRWPTGHPSPDQLALIHRVIAHSYAAGCRFLSVPIHNRNGQTITRVTNVALASNLDLDSDRRDVVENETLWEVSPWMPGRSDYCDDSNAIRRRNMMRALASFHLATAQVTLDFHTSQNLQRRYSKLVAFSGSANLRMLENAELASSIDLDAELAQEINDLRQLVTGPGPALVRKLLSSAYHPTFLTSNGPSVLPSMLPSMILPVQPILRDVWHDHVLFSGDTVTGIIDYGAMQIDNVAFDIARLLGTTVADNQELWDQSVTDYCELRRLSEMELGLLPWIDQTGVFLGSCHWIQWLMIEKRTFRDWSLVKHRVRFHKQRMQRLIEKD